MSIIYKPHVCPMPPANTPDDPHEALPLYNEGTLWECETCGKHWRYLIRGCLYLGDWERVRFWHPIAKYRIRKARR